MARAIRDTVAGDLAHRRKEAAGIGIGQSYWQVAWRRLRKHRLAIIGGTAVSQVAR